MRIDLSEVGRPKLSPLIVTTVPPAVGPLGTERDLMMGHTLGSVHSFRFEASPSLCPFPESSESFPLSSDPFETARSGEDLGLLLPLPLGSPLLRLLAPLAPLASVPPLSCARETTSTGQQTM